MRGDPGDPTDTAQVSEPPAELRLDGQTLAGRYRMETCLGEGGIGVVYRAVDTKTGQSVAVKVLRELYGAQRSYRRRFEREARALTALQHPHIVGVVDHGVAEDMPYLVMELLSGSTLGDVLAERGALSWEQARLWMAQLLSGLEYVHSQGLLHRDLKPGNVFIERAGGVERVRLLDFGLVKFIGSKGEPLDQATLTRTGELFGTPGYMPPEQILGQTAGPRADVYSATVVLFEMLAGKRPFHGRLADMARQQLDGVVPTLQQVRPSVRAVDQLQALFQKGLHRDVTQRFEDVADLRAALDALPPLPMVPVGRALGPGFATADTVLNRPAAATRPARAVTPKGSEHETLPMEGPERAPRAGALPTTSLWRTLFSWLVVLGVVAVFIAALTSREGTDDAQETSVVRASGDEPAAAEDDTDDAKKKVPYRRTEAPPEPAPAQASEVSPEEEGEGPSTESEAAPDDPRVPARNPWRGPTPSYLRTLRRQMLAGRPGRESAVRRLRQHNREHAEDPRGHLVLAGFYMNRGWARDAIKQYAFAVSREPSARGDTRMLRNLVRTSSGSVWSPARALIVEAYGAEALPAVTRALNRKPRPPADKRLASLRAQLLRLRDGEAH